MRIGALARATGVSTRSLRYYEQKQLLKPARHSNGYREYDSTAPQRVRNIRMLIEAGFGCDEIRQLGDCLGRDLSTEPVCEKVLDLGDRQLRELESRIVRLLDTYGQLREHLGELQSARRGRPGSRHRQVNQAAGQPPSPPKPPAVPHHQPPPTRRSSPATTSNAADAC